MMQPLQYLQNTLEFLLFRIIETRERLKVWQEVSLLHGCQEEDLKRLILQSLF